MARWNTDALRGGDGRSLPLQSIALGFAMFSAAYLFSLNRNVLYLSFLAASCIIVSVFVTRYPAMFACLGLFAFLTMLPPKIPTATFIEPTEKRENFKNLWAVAPPTEGAWQYEFDVVDLQRHQRECGGTLRGNLVVNGFGLDGLVLEAGGKRIATNNPGKLYDTQQLLVPLDEKTTRKFLVALQRKPDRTSTAISVGTEAHQSRIYSDAVWLEFRNERCAVMYHARRRVLSIGVQSGPPFGVQF